MAKRQPQWFSNPSWWIVVVAGSLFVTFSIGIVRELLNSHQVRHQVQTLQNQVATEQHRQQQLQDLIDYLGSPTFQEQEARLKLGLKKNGEQVIVVPPTNTTTINSASTQTSTTTDSTGAPMSHPAKWWQYFFGSRPSSANSNT